MTSQTQTKLWNAAQMIAHLDWIEVTEKDRQYRAVMIRQRDALAHAISTREGEAVTAVMDSIRELAAMWGDESFR